MTSCYYDTGRECREGDCCLPLPDDGNPNSYPPQQPRWQRESETTTMTDADRYPAPDESRVEWGNPSDPKFPAKIKAWDEGYALGIKRSDAEITDLRAELAEADIKRLALHTKVIEVARERDAMRGVVDAAGRMESALAKALNNRGVPPMDALLSIAIGEVADAFRAAQQELTDD